VLLLKRPTEPQQWIQHQAIETFQQVREIADPRSVAARKNPRQMKLNGPGPIGSV